MKTCKTLVAAAFFTLAATNVAMAYKLTPFVETANVGETQTHLGFLARLTEDSTQCLVIVYRGCTGGYAVLYATADKGVVSDNDLGKPVMITAEVTLKTAFTNVRDPVVKLKVLEIQDVAMKED